MKDAERRNLQAGTLSKYRLFEKMMKRFVAKKGLRFLAEFTPDLVGALSESWPLRNSAAGRQMDCIRSFFDFARLRTAKTGTVVYLPLPPFAVAALEAVKRPNGYFFWTGASRTSSVADTWRKRLAPVFKRAKIHGAHPHRFATPSRSSSCFPAYRSNASRSCSDTRA